MSVLEDVRASIRERRDELKPLADEYAALAAAAAALGGLTMSSESGTKAISAPDKAPYGRKADGSPRKRPGRRRQEPEAQPELTPYERAKLAAENGAPATNQPGV